MKNITNHDTVVLLSERRLIIGPCRSGTTMLYRSLKNHPDVVTEFQTIKEGQRETGSPDYAFYDRAVPDGKILVDKETVGYGNEADCRLAVFPNDDAIRETCPIFFFRDPRAALASWIENNLVSEETGVALFIQAYRHVYDLLLHALEVSPHVNVITYEELCKAPEQFLRKLCETWGIPFDPAMVAWQDDFRASTELDADGVQEGHYDAVASQGNIGSARVRDELPPEYEEEIQRVLAPIYQHIQEIVRSRNSP